MELCDLSFCRNVQAYAALSAGDAIECRSRAQLQHAEPNQNQAAMPTISQYSGQINSSVLQ